MMTQNNFFTHIQKWSCRKSDTKAPPKFYRQVFELKNKIIVPYDELTSWKNEMPIGNLVPHFFIADDKQVCFADNPQKHSDILDSCFAVFSPDYSVFTNVYSQFNNAALLLNRLIAILLARYGKICHFNFIMG